MAESPSRSPSDKPCVDPTFEEALRQLDEIVHDLEEGEIGLDDALRRYEEGVKLLRRCNELLQGAERRIELLTGVDAEGNPITRPLADESTLSLEQKGASRSRRRTAPGPDAPSEGKSTRPRETDIDGPVG